MVFVNGQVFTLIKRDFKGREFSDPFGFDLLIKWGSSIDTKEDKIGIGLTPKKRPTLS